MTDFLFIGNFLSKTRGSKGPSETIIYELKKKGFSIQSSSTIENQYFRILDIIRAVVSFHGKTIFIDVYSGAAFKIAEIVSKIAVFRNKKLILILHGGKLSEFESQFPARVKKVFNRAFRIQTPSHFIKNYFEKKGYSIQYKSNAINLTAFSYSKPNLEPIKLLWVRAFNSIYNPELAIRILQEVKKLYPEVSLTMVGPDNGLRTETEKLIQELNLLDSVKMVGSVPNHELLNYYQSHSVYINTTSYESFGMSMMEAAACGIPMVSTSVGEIPFLWTHQENILLVNDFDPNGFASCIQNLISDQNLYQRISHNAAQKANQFNLSDLLISWQHLLTELNSN